ncbi:MAG: hypothetical protein V4671_31145 [Armatimonadota bacterium]
MWRSAVLTAGCMLAAFSLIGCKAEAPALSSKEKADFKGGPMPEDVRRKMQEDMTRVRSGQTGGATANQAPTPTK